MTWKAPFGIGLTVVFTVYSSAGTDMHGEFLRTVSADHVCGEYPYCIMENRMV